MKKALFATFVASLLQTGLLGCYFEPPEPPEPVYAWTNESGVDVKMIVVKYFPDNKKSKFTFEKVIANGDTLHGNYSEYRSEEWYPYSNSYFDYLATTKVKLIFLEEPEKCLIFDGEIDDSFDIRNEFSYKAGDLIESSSYSTREFVYAITQELRDTAEKEHCGIFL